MEHDTGLERKFARFGDGLEVHDGHVICGYASLFGAVDQGNDIVEAGAYAASLSDLVGKGGRVKMLWQHDPKHPIGIWDEVREDTRGLWVKGRLLDSVARKATKNSKGQRLLTELELWEVSLVTFPMLPSARITAKAEETDLDRTLRDMAAAFKGARADLARR
jgi:phage head maturation protease